MEVKTFDINGVNVVDSGGRADWNFVRDTPTISISGDSHSHTDRYYTKSEVDTRLSSLDAALVQLQEKVDKLI